MFLNNWVESPGDSKRFSLVGWLTSKLGIESSCHAYVLFSYPVPARHACVLPPSAQLVGACINQNPGLFSAAVAQVRPLLRLQIGGIRFGSMVSLCGNGSVVFPRSP